jgi:hypothetical protein
VRKFLQDRCVTIYRTRWRISTYKNNEIILLMHLWLDLFYWSWIAHMYVYTVHHC